MVRCPGPAWAPCSLPLPRAVSWLCAPAWALGGHRDLSPPHAVAVLAGSLPPRGRGWGGWGGCSQSRPLLLQARGGGGAGRDLCGPPSVWRSPALAGSRSACLLPASVLCLPVPWRGGPSGSLGLNWEAFRGSVARPLALASALGVRMGEASSPRAAGQLDFLQL